MIKALIFIVIIDMLIFTIVWFKLGMPLVKSVKPFHKWEDIWIGGYWDRENSTLYLLVIPCLGLKIKFGWS